MLRVNLLPWRQRQCHRRYGFWRRWLFVGVASETALLLLWGWLLQQHDQRLAWQLSSLSAYEGALQTQVAKVNTLKLAYQQAEQLNQQNRQRFQRSLHYIQLLKHVAQAMPDGLWATRLSLHHAELSLGGEGTAYQDILALSEALPGDGAVSLVQLREVKQLANADLQFSLSAALSGQEGEL
ncbi:MAG: PilN domain-containing protein [Rouxiella aceris]|uniref:PilN domain-containing protein n=1 Tax=Rouxiella aceris TaxID=2703884 RepID=UPI0028456F22|nr:PilN domain-containing protein [Rouxiella aceris]MDR3430495.1 PilN domain-containing protein [Rouxiella aceris]